MKYALHTSGSCGIAVVKFKERRQKLVKIARKYTVPYRDRMFQVLKNMQYIVHTLVFCGIAVVTFIKKRR